jgi:HEAT repeat protein
VRVAVEPFLGDMSEPVRFTSATTLFAINDPQSLPALAAVIESDESRRIQNRIAQGLVDRAWSVPPELSESLKKALPPGFRLVGDNVQKS